MKKHLTTIYVLILYVLFWTIVMSLFGMSLSGCNVYVGKSYSKCPTNDKTYFYKRMGVKPSKAYMRWGNK
jgi:hypothetical protein